MSTSEQQLLFVTGLLAFGFVLGWWARGWSAQPEGCPCCDARPLVSEVVRTPGNPAFRVFQVARPRWAAAEDVIATPGVPQLGDGHPSDPSLRVVTVHAVWVGADELGEWEVRIKYKAAEPEVSQRRT